MLAVLRREVRKWKTPIVGVVAEKTRDPFWVLVSCVLSLRTKDGTTAEATARLQALAKTPAEMLHLSVPAIARAIYPVGFYKTKARHLRQICADLIVRFGGRVPDTIEELLTLKGVGRKTANLVVTVGYGKPGICVDTHVHRISNRWGYVRTKTPEETENALRAKLPRRHWITYNDLLVTFGQNLCAPVSPQCSRCPLASFCPKIGVEKSR
ncbi:MAG: endonuclease III [Nitrospirae bacterium RBG_16_64_22]|nr:MAG: endonuclease III [Nitrospirae bacterium RBG_16_64_22]